MTSNNISFFLEEKHVDNSETKNNEILKMLNELETNDDELTNNIYDINNNNVDDFYNELIYFTNKKFYCHDETYYDIEYTVKELIKICEYYEIDKNIKASKCKKQDIIATIVYFESLPENIILVQKRHNMWAYMRELFNDSKMKKYILWTK
jgi:hypothetical protein